ncbi:hypothetical protein AAVH_01317 [Aphelenchoides avenae]|nr:hypothetical protein AAVH_01317 [Aphelenchus avenae]
MEGPDILRRIECVIVSSLLSLTSIAQSSTAVVMQASLGSDGPKTLFGKMKCTFRMSVSFAMQGRGYPDFDTRTFLRWLYEHRPLPMYSLVDADPHGIEILATYRYGAERSKVESGNLSLPQLQWLGEREKHNDAQMVRELNVLQLLGHKLEIEAVSTIRMHYLSDDYLAKKLYR